jgi:hypothetical protein
VGVSGVQSSGTRPEEDMVINFSCPSCGKAYQLPQSVVGKTVPCNQCRTAMEIPATGQSAGKTASKGSASSRQVPKTGLPTAAKAEKKSTRLYIVVSLLAVVAIGLVAVVFVGGRSQSVEVVTSTEDDDGSSTEDDAVTENDSSDSNNNNDDDTQESETGSDQTDAEKAAAEAEAKRKAEEAEAKRKAEEAEAKRIAEEAEAKRMSEEADAKRKADADEAKRNAKGVIRPNWQDQDASENFPDEIIARKNDLGTVGSLFYIDFSVAKNKPPSPKIIPYQPGERRVADDRWTVEIHSLIEKTLWKMTTNYGGKKYVIAYLRYIADEGTLRLYRASSEGLQGSDLAVKKIGTVKYKDLLVYSQLIQIHEGTYISAGISTATLIGKLPGEQLVDKARHTGLAVNKPTTPPFNSHEGDLQGFYECADKGFTIRPEMWNWRLVSICYRPNNTTKWKQFPVDLFDEVKTAINIDSTFDNYGLKLKCGNLTYKVSLPIDLNANLLLTESGDSEVIVKLINLKAGLEAASKSKVVNETAKANNAEKLRMAKRLSDFANDISDTQAIEKANVVRDAQRQFQPLNNLAASLENQIKGDVASIAALEKEITVHLAANIGLAAIKDDMKELNKYSNSPDLGQHYLKLCLEISQARRLSNGEWINVPIWHASPVQPILDEKPGSAF